MTADAHFAALRRHVAFTVKVLKDALFMMPTPRVLANVVDPLSLGLGQFTRTIRTNEEG